MAVEKTYQVTGPKKMLTLHTKFMVAAKTADGKTVEVPRYVTAKGHLRPRRKKGEFKTSDPALIKAIDDYLERTGSKARLILLNEKDIDENKAERTPTVVLTDEGYRFENEVRPGDIKEAQKRPATPVTGINNVQQAKEYLMNNFEGVTTRDVSNKEKITRLAEEKNIVFVDMN